MKYTLTHSVTCADRAQAWASPPGLTRYLKCIWVHWRSKITFFKNYTWWPWPHFHLPWCSKGFLSAWVVKDKLFEKLHSVTLDDLDLILTFPAWSLKCLLNAWELKFLILKYTFWKIAFDNHGWPWHDFDLSWCLKCILGACEGKNEFVEK
mgnify:CR=1 FL=1